MSNRDLDITEQQIEQLDCNTDYYEALGLSCNCTRKEIKRAYKKLVQKYHPDRNGDPVLFHLITEAYNVLISPTSRRNYNEHGRLTPDERNIAHGYIVSVIEQVVSCVEDLAFINMVKTLEVTTDKNIDSTEVEIIKQKKIKVKFEKNEHRSKDKAIVEVFKRHKGIAINAIEALEKDLRTFSIALVLLRDYEYNFDAKPAPKSDTFTYASAFSAAEWLR